MSSEREAENEADAPAAPRAEGASLPSGGDEPSASVGPSLALRSGYSIQAIESPQANVVHLKAPDGRICVTIALRPEGPAVEVRAGSLAIVAEGDLRIDCGRLSIRAEEDLAIRAGRDMVVSAEGALTTEASSQHIKARLGEVRVQANDDVRLDGERIRLNSPPPARPAPGLPRVPVSPGAAPPDKPSGTS